MEYRTETQLRQELAAVWALLDAQRAERDALLAAIPEGCTPADAETLREANHQLAAECEALQAALAHARAAVESAPVPRTWAVANSRHSWVTSQDLDDYRVAVLRALGGK